MKKTIFNEDESFSFERASDEDSNTMFASLLDDLDDCPSCEYVGPLELRRGGYKCPTCHTLVIPNV